MKRVKTGIEGLDLLTSGGFPENSVNLLSGPAGSAKSIMCMQYIYAGAKDHNERGIYISLEESRRDILRAMDHFSMDISKYEKSGAIQIVDLGEIRRGQPLDRKKGMVGFDNIGKFIEQRLKASKAKRVVIDSLSAAGLHYRSPEELREEMFEFCRNLKEHDVTTLLTTESIEGEHLTRYNIEQFVADSFIVLGLEAIKGELRRTMTVRKMRFTKHDTSKHPVLITKDGVVVAHQEKVI